MDLGPDTVLAMPLAVGQGGYRLLTNWDSGTVYVTSSSAPIPMLAFACMFQSHGYKLAVAALGIRAKAG